MPVDYLYAFVPILGLFVNLCVQVMSLRIRPSIGAWSSVLLGFIFGFLSLLMLEVYIFFSLDVPIRDFLAFLMVHIITYASLGYCYFIFINLGETARRIRILRELYEASDGLTLEEILQRYNAKEIVERRLSRLVEKGQVLFKNDRYYISQPLFFWIAKFLSVFKNFIFRKKSGID